MVDGTPRRNKSGDWGAEVRAATLGSSDFGARKRTGWFLKMERAILGSETRSLLLRMWLCL